ncbi:tetratricopeptide repeat protein [bacterium LRH843]|nr:tetratricopeptide repeat protein [bacterium LRH843]
MELTPESDRGKRKVVPLFRSGDYFFQRGIEAYHRNHFHRAIKLLERAVKLTTKEPVFHVQLAAVLSEIGEYERSNEILSQVLAENGDALAECYFFIANNYAYLGQFDKAERATLKYLDLQPDDQFTEDAHDLLELLHFERENDDWEEFDAQEDDLIVRHERAHSLLRNGEVQASIPMLEAIIHDHPTCFAAKNHLAEAYFRLGNEKAFQICDDVLLEDKGNLFAICNLALFYTEKGEANNAEPYIEAIKKVYPLDGDHYIKVAETLCAVGEYDSAYERLKELGKGEFEVRPALFYCMGVALFHLNDQPKALTYITKAAKRKCKQAIDYLNCKKEGQENVELSYHVWNE